MASGDQPLERLRRRELQALSAHVAELYEFADLPAFRRRLVQILPSVVHADAAVYAEVDPRSGRVTFGPEVEMLGVKEGQTIFSRHMGDLPTFQGYRRGEGSAVKVSDFVTSRQFRRTGLYNEFYRRAGLEHQMSKGLPGLPGLVTAITLLRRSPDFSERDRLLLNVLRPHLNQAYRNARALDAMQVELAALRSGVEAIEQGLIVLDRRGLVATMTARAHRLIKDYFGPFPVTGLPPALATWLRHTQRQLAAEDDAPTPRTPLTRAIEGRQLVVRLVSMADHSVLVLSQRHTRPTPEGLGPLGLSRRESEVLTWVAEGKTNGEIAVILGVRPRTIDKHLERVFQKLGVETRTAAAARALSLAQP